MTRIVVIGAGISGLATATYLQDTLPRGSVHITIISELFPLESIVSTVAGAVVLVARQTYKTLNISEERCRQLVQRSHEHYSKLAADGHSLLHGVTTRYGHVLIGTGTVGEHVNVTEAPLVADFTEVRASRTEEIQRLVPSYVCSGWYMKACFIDTRKYLMYLLNKFVHAGGSIQRHKVASLEEVHCGRRMHQFLKPRHCTNQMIVAGVYDVIINCAGLGSRELVNDQAMHPVKGQIVKYHTAGKVTEFLYVLDVEERPTGEAVTRYVLPHAMEAIVGGTHEEGNESTETDYQNINEIKRFANTVPGLRECQVIQEIAGLRPARTTGLRLEVEHLKTVHGSKLVIHNYGHSGLGYGTSVGCAHEVFELLIKNCKQLVKPCL